MAILKAVRLKDVRFLYSPVEQTPIPCVLAPCSWPPSKTIILFQCRSVWHFEKHLLWDSHCLCASEASNGLFICKPETHIYRWDSKKNVYLSVASGIRVHVERNRPTKASSLLLFWPQMLIVDTQLTDQLTMQVRRWGKAGTGNGSQCWHLELQEQSKFLSMFSLVWTQLKWPNTIPDITWWLGIFVKHVYKYIIYVFLYVGSFVTIMALLDAG